MSSSTDPVVIGIFGVSGAGKTFTLNALSNALSNIRFAFYEGSDVIAKVTPGGLSSFKQLSASDQRHWRETAIRDVETACRDENKTAIVAGHCMFWSKDEGKAINAITDEDLRIYTHIIYLDTRPDIVYTQSRNDASKPRLCLSTDEISQWQYTEKDALRQLCAHNRILFSIVTTGEQTAASLSKLVLDFALHNEEYNQRCVEKRLDILFQQETNTSITLVLDADRTIAGVDTGKLFWERCNKLQPSLQPDVLKKLFGGPLGYSYTAFRQAALLYEALANTIDLEAVCDDLSETISLYPEVDAFLQHASTRPHVKIVIITCGLAPVWQKVINKARLSNSVHILGACRIDSGFVITPDVKGKVVLRLRNVHRQLVYAFGDSPLDIEMLKHADKAFVVVGEADIRSKTMDNVLSDAISAGLTAQQILLPESVSPRLDETNLPVTTLPQITILLNPSHARSCSRRIIEITNSSAAKILTTATRNADCAGPQLREAYRLIGRHLAVTHLTTAVGLEEYDIPHVQGGTTLGYRLCNEKDITIVALMRGGEPIASGINEVFPSARYVHAKKPEDVKLEHVSSQSLVLLVDTVVNEGLTMADFVSRVMSLSPVRIIMVAGVVQDQSIHTGGTLSHLFSEHDRVDLVTLRISENKFKGSGTTDTSNRLFNTTHLQ